MLWPVRISLTLKDVAARAGVSRSTAGHVLNGRGRELGISAECERRVREAARALNYQRNHSARTLALGRSNTVGLAMRSDAQGSLLEGFWASIAVGVEQAARRRNYDLLLINTFQAGKIDERFLECLQSGRIDALVVTAGFLYAIPPEMGLPIVFVGSMSSRGFPHVVLDPAPGIEAAMQHLASLGHREAAWIDAMADKGPLLPERRAAFEQAAAAAGLRPRFGSVPHADISWRVEARIEAYRQSIRNVLPGLKGATAVLCYNDLMAVALCAAARDLGMRIPDDLSVVGFDDLYAAQATPALTTISHELREMGGRALEMALELAEGRRGGSSNGAAWVEQVPARLIIRQSTVPPRKNKAKARKK